MASGGSIAFGPFIFDVDRCVLHRNGDEIVLGTRGYALIEALMRADGETVPRDVLSGKAWPGLVVDDSNLPVQIAALRKALGTQADGSEWISTVPRVGYRLVRPAVTRPAWTKPSIAVLPFADFSADGGQAYFADGLVEDLITALSRFKEFAVAARNSSFAYLNQSVDVRVVARELGVRYVLEGSVRRAGNRLRVSAQLIDGISGEHIWAEKYDGGFEGVFDVQDQLVDRVVASVEPQIRRAEIERSRRKRPDSLDAYELYLHALPLMQSTAVEGYSAAIGLLDRAMELDSDFAPALALSAWARGKRLKSGHSPDDSEDRRVSTTLAERALSLDSTDPMVLAMAGYQIMDVQGDIGRGHRLLAQAQSQNPNSFITVNFYGYAKQRKGEYDEAIALHQRALRLMPGATEAIWCLSGIANAHLSAGRFEEALVWCLRSIELNDGYDWTFAIAAAAYAHLGRRSESRDCLTSLLALRPEITIDTLFPRRETWFGTDRFLVEGLVLAGLDISAHPHGQRSVRLG